MDEQDDEHDDLEHDPDPDLEDPILARSREILSRVPTPEEVAEHEERSRANRLDAIMAGDRVVPRYEPEIVRKVRRDALVTQSDAADPGHGLPRGSARVLPRECSPRGRTPPPDEAALLEQWAERCANIASMRPPEALREIVRTLGGFAIATHRRHARLETKVAKLKRRITKLRRAAKAGREAARADTAKASDRPRIRVKAGRREVSS